MHNIDINFLKDRKLDALASSANFKRTSAASAEERSPIIIGAVIGVALIALTGGGLFFLNNQKSAQSKAITELENEILRLQGKNQAVQTIQNEINNINREVGILVSVFDQIKPWSAMLSEIANVTPANVQIRSITQSNNQDLTINGYAVSYDNVNDLFLTLKNSSLLNSEETKLTTSTLVDNPSTIIFDRSQLDKSDKKSPLVNNTRSDVEIELPQVVLYTINTAISNESSQKFLSQLNRQGAIGLVSRLTSLQRQGALKIDFPELKEQSTQGEVQQ